MPPTQPFARTPLTWLTYLMLGYFAYLQAALGPLMPYLLAELDISYTVGGLHFSAFAAGMILTGLVGGRLVARWGRWRVFWGGGLGMAVGALGITAGGEVAQTLTGAGLMGLFGGALLIVIPATLSDLYPARRTTALTEANAMASLWAMSAPLAIGTLAAWGLGWRSALVLAVILWVVMAAGLGRIAFPATSDTIPATGSQAPTTLPRAFVAFCGVMFLVVSVEWSLAAWGAAYLEDGVGLSKSRASGLMGLFFLAMLAGRLVASRLAHLATSSTLLLIALGLTALGFPLFWLASLPALNIAGLFVLGIGVANVYPFSLACALDVVQGRSDRAAAWLSLTVGVAILVTPLTLGGIADRLDLRQAYGLVALLLVAAVVMTLWARRLGRGIDPPRAIPDSGLGD